MVAPRARIGLIIPSVNTMSEPQFNAFAPPGLAVHVARARVTGPWKRPLPDMAEAIALAARQLSDVAPDLIVFHCTDTAMSLGLAGEARIIEIVREAADVDAVATGQLVLEALRTLGIERLLLLTPYANNGAIVEYLESAGYRVVVDVALGLSGRQSVTVTPQGWCDLAGKHDRPDVDGVFLSCTNTTQIEAIEPIERVLGKRVVASNQAVLWGCIARLKARLEPLPAMQQLGALLQHLS